MGQIKKQKIYEGLNGIVEEFTINFNGGLPPDLQKLIISSQTHTAGNRLGIVITTSNCTGLSGLFTLKQSVEDSGTPNFPFTPAVTITPVVSGSVAAGIATAISFALTRVILDGTAIVWPTAGTMKITIVSKF